jgi:glycosyltransferase involved in cell wall biosynthesis
LEGVDSFVIYNSIPFDFSVNEQPVDTVNGKRFILDVNRFNRYKNAEILIRSFNQIKNEIPHLLYLKGNKLNPAGYDFLKTLVSELKLENRVILDDSYRSKEEMRYLYRHADLFVSPSLKEGFGWTPIEAAILKTPVLISNIDVLMEVTCNKLPNFNPRSSNELSKKVLELLKNPPEKEEREKLAMFYLRKYSLKNQIDKMVKVFMASVI